jgi:hypothetical protein
MTTTMEATMATLIDKNRISEVVDRGDAIFRESIQPKLGPEWDDQFVAIDVDTGEHEIDPVERNAVDRLRNRLPKPTIYVARAGSPVTHYIGSWR